MSHVTNHRRHWLVVISCCLMVAVSPGLFTNAYGVFYTPLAEKLGTGRGAVAVHATIAGMVTAFSYDLTGGYRLASAASVACGALGLICIGILRKKLRTK